MSTQKKIAIIGAGLSGLHIARELSNGYDIHIFEKARGVGGRMSTRYTDNYSFDHGAQCFTIRTQEFEDFLTPFIENSTVQEWKGRVINLEIGKKPTERKWNETHFVFAPKMNALCKHLAAGLNIKLSTKIKPLGEKTSDKWQLFNDEDVKLGEFDFVISTAPPEQTIVLFEDIIDHNSHITQSKLAPCFALMLGFPKPWSRDWIAAKIHNNPIKWVSINSSKPGRRNEATSIVCHTRQNWSEQNLESSLEENKNILLSEFKKITDINPSDADHIDLHRWRFATIDKSDKLGPYFDAKQCLASTGDWCNTSRIEEVFLASNELINLIKKHYARN